MLLVVASVFNPSATYSCMSALKILQGGPLPLAFNEDRIAVGGEYFFPDADAPKYELRSTVLVYSGASNQLQVFRSNEAKSLPKNVTAIALSSDRVFVNGERGVIELHGNENIWHSMPGLENKQVTALAWDGHKLWIGTSSDLLIYEEGRITKAFSSDKYFDGFGIISIIPSASRIFVGTYKPPPVQASDSSLEGCGRMLKGPEPESSFRGAAYVTDIQGEKFLKVDPHGVFDSAAKARVLFDVYPSTDTDQLEIAAGDGLDIGTERIARAPSSHRSAAPSSPLLRKYNPFLALIAKAGRQATEREASTIENFLNRAFDDLPLNAKLWAFDAQFNLWERAGEWKRFDKLDNPKRLWAASFLSNNPNPRAQRALLRMLKVTGASAGVVERLDEGHGEAVNDLLIAIIRGSAPLAKPSEDKTTRLADPRDEERTRLAAIHALKARLGTAAAPRLLALLKSQVELPGEIDKRLRQTLYDLAPGKWVLRQVDITGNMSFDEGALNTPTGPYVSFAGEASRPAHEAYLSGYKPNGDFKITLALPLKGTYVLHYGKARTKTRSFKVVDQTAVTLGRLH